LFSTFKEKQKPYCNSYAIIIKQFNNTLFLLPGLVLHVFLFSLWLIQEGGGCCVQPGLLDQMGTEMQLRILSVEDEQRMRGV